MNRLRLARDAFKNMMRAAARDPLWAFLALITMPFRIWKRLLGFMFILFNVTFVISILKTSMSRKTPVRLPTLLCSTNQEWRERRIVEVHGSQRHRMFQNEFVEISIEGDRPWNRLSELVWIRQRAFFNCMASMPKSSRCFAGNYLGGIW